MSRLQASLGAEKSESSKITGSESWVKEIEYLRHSCIEDTFHGFPRGSLNDSDFCGRQLNFVSLGNLEGDAIKSVFLPPRSSFPTLSLQPRTLLRGLYRAALQLTAILTTEQGPSADHVQCLFVNHDKIVSRTRFKPGFTRSIPSSISSLDGLFVARVAGT